MLSSSTAPFSTGEVFRALLEGMPDFFAFLLSVEDPDTVLWVSPQVHELTGFTVDDWVDRRVKWSDLVRPEERPALAVFQAGLANADTFSHELRTTATVSRVSALHMSGFRLRDAHGRAAGHAGIARDVSAAARASERVTSMESELVHAHRLLAAGQLAAWITHEISHPLASIANYAAGLAHRIPTGDQEVRDGLSHIASEAERAGTLIRRMRDFLKKRELRMGGVDVCEVIRAALDLVGGRCRSMGIDPVVDLAPRIPPLEIDPVQIQQVVVNQLQNALDALESVPRDERSIRVLARPEGRNEVRVAVIDSGPGLPAQDKTRLFEPYWSTRPDGLGLGLVICHAIIEAHRGRLEAGRNPAGRGSSFSFVLTYEPV